MTHWTASMRLVLSLVASACLLGCEDRELVEGLDQPLRVHGAQFVREALPGTPATSGGSERPREPTTTSALTEVAFLRERSSSIRFSGLATSGAVAIAVRFAQLGDGYWLVPTGAPDPQADNRASWSFVADLGTSLPAGRHTLLVVAIDEDGRAGTQASSNLCIRSAIPDNGNACAAAIEPPALVISLGWDTPVDLDLKVRTPDGTIIDAKRPSSGPVDEQGAIDSASPGAGNLELDSNRDCAIDGRQRESVVFQSLPAAGTYTIYANLQRACGQEAVSYVATYHVATRVGDGKFSTRFEYIGAGALVAEQANADTQIGTFVGEVSIR